MPPNSLNICFRRRGSGQKSMECREIKLPQLVEAKISQFADDTTLICRDTLFFFFYKNVVFSAQAEYSYFSADFRLKIFLYYS